MRDYAKISPPSFEESRLKSRARYNKRCAVWKKTGGYCHYCRAPLLFAGWEAFHCDHAAPKSRGGSNGIANLVPACPHCNYSKWNRENWTVAQRGPKRQTRYERLIEKLVHYHG